MGWMKAIATDVDELLEDVLAVTPAELPERIREKGWVSPTESELVRRLIRDSIAGTGQPGGLARAIAILGGSNERSQQEQGSTGGI